MDIDTIEPGTNFVEALQQASEWAEVLIVLIGKHWLSSTDDPGRRRLDDPKDFVRLEITTALDRHIRVIPILVQGATMPRQEELPDPLRGLARQQSLELSDARWSYDMQLLIRALRERGADRAVRKLSSKLREAWGIVAKPLVATFLILITLIIPNG